MILNLDEKNNVLDKRNRVEIVSRNKENYTL